MYVVCAHTGTRVEIRRQLSGVLSFHHMDPRDQIRIVRLAGKCSYLLSHLALGSFKTLNVVSCYHVQTNTVSQVLPFSGLGNTHDNSLLLQRTMVALGSGGARL